MSFREVTALRKAGQLDDALAMAREDYYEFGIDSYSASALFWTLRLVCERSLASGDSSAAIAQFNELQEVFQNVDNSDGIAGRCFSALEAKVNPEYAKINSFLALSKAGQVDAAMEFVRNLDITALPPIVRENIGWICYYYLKVKICVISEEDVNSVAEFYFSLSTEAPSMLHTLILQVYIKYAGINRDYDLPSFLNKWDVKNFVIEDSIIDPKFPNARPLIERAISRCFINKTVTLATVESVFEACPYTDEESVSSALSHSYSYLLYKDSVEEKNKRQFFADAEEYVNRLAGKVVRNQYHSKILDSVLWEIEDSRLGWYKSFFEKWGMGDGLMDADWERTVLDGHTLPSIGEKAIGKYGDAIEYGTNAPVYSDEYKKILDLAQEKASDNEIFPRRKAKISYSEGRKEDAVEIMMQLIKTHQGKYYFWYELAQFVAKTDRDLCISCCAKALLSSNDEKYVGKVHLVMAQLFHERGRDSEALAELERYRKTCEENNWPPKPAYQKISCSIPENVIPAQNLNKSYKELERAADEFVYSDVPGHNMILIDRVYEEKEGKKKLFFYLYDESNLKYKVNPNAFGLDKKTPLLTCFSVKYVVDGDRKRIISIKNIEPVNVLSYRLGVIDNINSEKKVIHIIGKDFQLVIPQDRFFKKYNLGETFEVAYSAKRSKDGKLFYTFIHAKRTEAKSDLIIKFEGPISLKENEKGPFGFVDGVFIPRPFLSGLSDEDYVFGTGVKDSGKTRVLSLSVK